MMSITPSNSNIPPIPPKLKMGTSQIQHYFDNALDILSKNTQHYLNYLKYLTECSRQLKKVNETLSGLSYDKEVHPQLKETQKIFNCIEKSNQEMRKFIKSDEVKNCEKREGKENDFLAKKRQELKKLCAQITSLHNHVIRIIKKPPDYVNCFNALEDGFKFHCSYLFYCTQLTSCQEKLFGYINEIHEEVLNIRKDLAKLQYECNDNAFKLFLQNNPQYNNSNAVKQDHSTLSPEIVDQIAEKFDYISKHIKKSVSVFREPKFPTLHLYVFSAPFKPPSELGSESHTISVNLNPQTPILIEPEKILASKSVEESITLPDKPSEVPEITQPDQEENNQEAVDDSEAREARLEDFLASDSGSDDEPFHEMNSSIASVALDTHIENNWQSGNTSSVSSNHSPLRSVSSNDGGSANYHQKISCGLSAKPRQSMKFIAMKQYKCEDFGKELSVEEKDIVTVLDANMTEYWYCKKGNSEGFLPAIILEPYVEQNKRLKSMVIKESLSAPI